MTEETREKLNTEMPEGSPDGEVSAEARESVTEAEMPAEVTQAVSGKKTRIKKGLLIALGACAILLVAGTAFVNHYLGKIGRIDPESQSVLSPSEAENILATMTDEYDPGIHIRIDDTTKAAEQTEETTKTGTVWQRGKKETVQETVDPHIGREFVINTKETEPEIDWEWKEAPPLDDKDRINIMLIGQDTRDITFRQFSDTMILVSVNPSTHDIAIVSFVRDLYVPIHEGYQDNRLNTPYYIGGTSYLKECIEKNFGLHIDGFVIINFGVFRKIVDVLGGIDITLTQYEAECAQDVLNRSYLDMVYWDEAMRDLDISLFGSSEETTEATTAEPTTEEPATEEPTTAESTTEEPTTAEPTTEEPTTAESTTEEPTTEEPATEEPATEEPTTAEPTTAEPTTEEPTTEETTSEEPAAEETATEKAADGTEVPSETENASESGNETNSAARSLEGLLAREDAGSRVVSGSGRSAAAPILLKSSKTTKNTTAESTEEETEEDPTPNFHAGWNHLNGNEALAYVRMRNQESDLNRTARQRRFMDIIFGKMKELEPAQLFEMLDAILPYITTDLTDLQIINYASRIVPYLKQSSFTTNRIPADDTYRYVFIRDMSVVQAVQQPNLDALAEWLSH